MTTTAILYRVTDEPDNGTVGQDCGTHSYEDLPAHIREAIDAAPDASEWRLPALSDGDGGEQLSDLTTIVRRA